MPFERNRRIDFRHGDLLAGQLADKNGTPTVASVGWGRDPNAFSQYRLIHQTP
jgi:hypothetical protein